jgi:hypothetical protein
VDELVELPACPSDSLGHSLAPFRTSYVSVDQMCPAPCGGDRFLRCPSGLLVAVVREKDVAGILRKGFCDRQSDTLRPSGDQDRLFRVYSVVLMAGKASSGSRMTLRRVRRMCSDATFWARTPSPERIVSVMVSYSLNCFSRSRGVM